jgi:hypothetical protein
MWAALIDHDTGWVAVGRFTLKDTAEAEGRWLAGQGLGRYAGPVYLTSRAWFVRDHPPPAVRDQDGEPA